MLIIIETSFQWCHTKEFKGIIVLNTVGIEMLVRADQIESHCLRYGCHRLATL